MAYLDHEEIVVVDGEAYDPIEVSLFKYTLMETEIVDGNNDKRIYTLIKG